MKLRHTIICVECFFAMAGCLPDVSGVDPPSDNLIYPVGMETTTNNEYLLVVNSNFDLRYNAGTVVALSLDKIHTIQENGGEPDWISKDGKFLYVPEAEVINPQDTIRIGAFSSDLALTPDGRRALIPVRGGDERSIVIIDVDETKKNGRVLSCGQDKDLECDRAHRVTSNDKVTLPLEPYEVASLVYNRKDAQGRELTSTIGFATHLYSGNVSAFVIENEGRLAAELISVAYAVVPEASGIAVRQDPESANNNEIYVTGRANAEQYIAILKLMIGSEFVSFTDKPYFGLVEKIGFASDLAGGTDARGIAVAPSGNTAFMVTRTPEALARIDLTSNELVDLTTLGTDPSVVSIYEDEASGKTFAFVLCFSSSQVYIVEPDTMQVYVRTTGSGPHAIAFDKERKWAYIANFRESTITVIEATPPFDHVRAGDSDIKLMIGKPRLPEK